MVQLISPDTFLPTFIPSLMLASKESCH
jgi:hypothetical protein